MTDLQQRPIVRETHGRHRGSYTDLWSLERDLEALTVPGRHRLIDSASEDERRCAEVAQRRLHQQF